MRGLHILRLFATGGAIGVCACNCFAHGRYLLDADASGEVFEYTNASPFFFDEETYDSATGARIGLMTFDYDTYSGDPDGTVVAGGAIAGGILLNPNATMRDGWSLHFVQTVAATVTGSAAQIRWGLGSSNAGTYPDAGPMDPAYAFEQMGNDPPALSMVDLPRRAFAQGDQSWFAELGLVAIADEALFEDEGIFYREARVIDTFQWGFAIDTSFEPFGAQNVSAQPAPSMWGSPSETYLETLNSYYDGLGGAAVVSQRFRFVDRDDVFLPSPGGMIVCAAGVCVWARRRTRLAA